MVLVSYKLIGLVGLLVMVMHFLQAGRKRETLPGMEEHMTTIDFITALFCQVDDPLAGLPKPPHATLWPSEIRDPGDLACAQRRGQPGVLPLADARLSVVISPLARADAPLSPLQDPSGL